MSSIRLRLGLTVFAVILFLLSAQIFVVLERIQRSAEDEVDNRLMEELAEVQEFLGTPQLLALIEAEQERRTKWDELFVKVVDDQNQVVAETRNFPEGGFRMPTGIAPVNGVRIWEGTHPDSRKGHRKLRIAEMRAGSYRIWVAKTLKRHQKQYWRLREHLVASLFVIAALGAISAYLVATRSLAPVRRMAERAQELSAALEGELPRTGSGDEIDRLAAVLNELLGRIRQEVARMRRMTADVSHALRTPLTALRGTLELHLRGTPHEADRLEPLLDEVDQLSHLVNELLLLEKLETARSDPRSFGFVDIGELTRELIEYLGALARERGIKLNCSAEAALVRGNRDQLRRALGNLVDNALRHTPTGGHVDVSARRQGDRVFLSVQDSGPGMTPFQLQHALERFYSEPGSGSGIGLGLPIARAIARSHGGELHASSPGGALFVIELPIASAE